MLCPKTQSISKKQSLVCQNKVLLIKKKPQHFSLVYHKHYSLKGRNFPIILMRFMESTSLTLRSFALRWMYSSQLITSVPANPISCSIHEVQQPGALVIAATLFPWPSHLSSPPQVPHSHCLSSVLPRWKLLVRCSLIPNLACCLW